MRKSSARDAVTILRIAGRVERFDSTSQGEGEQFLGKGSDEELGSF